MRNVMKVLLIISLTFGLFLNNSFAVDLYDCNLKSEDKTISIKSEIEKYLRFGLPKEFQTTVTTHVSARNKNKGQQVRYIKGDPILVGEIFKNKERTILSLNSKIDFLQQGLFGQYPFSFDEGEVYEPFFEMQLKDGEKYFALGKRTVTGFSWFLVRDNGKACKDVIYYSSSSKNTSWAGATYTGSINEVTITKKVIIERKKMGGIRLIYNGTEGGLISIQEVFVNPQGQINSQIRKFDQFGQTIDVAGFIFQLVNADSEGIVLRYEFDDSYVE